MAPFVMLLGRMATIHTVVKLAFASMIFATKNPNDTFYLNLITFIFEAPEFDSIRLVLLGRSFSTRIFDRSKLSC